MEVVPCPPGSAARRRRQPLGPRQRGRLSGHYGEYLLAKVAKVFPDLAARHGDDGAARDDS